MDLLRRPRAARSGKVFSVPPSAVAPRRGVWADSPAPRTVAMPATGLSLADMEIEMSQNLISLTLTDEQMTAVNAALDTLEQNLSGLIARIKGDVAN